MKYDGSVVEWLQHWGCDQHGPGSKPTHTILLSMLGKALYDTFPCLVVLASSSKLKSYLYLITSIQHLQKQVGVIASLCISTSIAFL